MSKSRKSPLQPIKHRLEYVAYRSLELSLKLFPVAAIFVLGLLFGAIAWIILPKRRRLVTKNLRIAFGEKLSLKEIHQLTFKNFCLTGANLVSSIKCALCSEKQISSMVRTSGIQHFIDAKEKNRGVITVIGHMGNWEILAQVTSILNPLLKNHTTNFGTIYRPLNNPLIDNLIRRRRQRRKLQALSKYDGFSKFASFIKDGGSLGILSDQRVGRHGIAALFFDRITSCSPLPEMLYKKTKAPGIALSLKTIGIAKWHLEIIPINGPLTTQNCTAELETAFRKSSADVFWMHDRWRCDRRRPLTPENRKQAFDSELIKKAKKPFRLIIAPPKKKPALFTKIIEAIQTKRPDIEIILFLEIEQQVENQKLKKVIRYPSGFSAEEIESIIIRENEKSITPFDALLILNDELKTLKTLRKPQLPLTLYPDHNDEILKKLGLE